MQVTGLTCDWLLLAVWGRLAILSTRPVPSFVWWGLAGAFLHMAEILPLVALLVGLVPSPSIFGEGSLQLAQCRRVSRMSLLLGSLVDCS